MECHLKNEIIRTKTLELENFDLKLKLFEALKNNNQSHDDASPHKTINSVSQQLDSHQDSLHLENSILRNQITKLQDEISILLKSDDNTNTETETDDTEIENENEYKNCDNKNENKPNQKGLMIGNVVGQSDLSPVPITKSPKLEYDQEHDKDNTLLEYENDRIQLLENKNAQLLKERYEMAYQLEDREDDVAILLQRCEHLAYDLELVLDNKNIEDHVFNTNKNRKDKEEEYVIGNVKLHDSTDSLNEYDPITSRNNHDMIRQKYFTRSIRPARPSINIRRVLKKEEGEYAPYVHTIDVGVGNGVINLEHVETSIPYTSESEFQNESESKRENEGNAIAEHNDMDELVERAATTTTTAKELVSETETKEKGEGEDFEDMLQMMIEIKEVAQEEISKWKKKYEKLKESKEKWKRRAMKAMQVGKSDATSHAKDIHKRLSSSSGKGSANDMIPIQLSSSATATAPEVALHIYYQEREIELMEALEGVIDHIENIESFTDNDTTRDRTATNLTNTTIFSNDSSVYDQDIAYQ